MEEDVATAAGRATEPGEDAPAAHAPARSPDARRFVEDFGLMLGEAGMPRMAARVFACVLADDRGRLSAPELAERLGASPAAISGAVRYLTQIHLLARGREPGERIDHYRIGSDSWYELFAYRAELLRRWERALDAGVDQVGADTAAGRRLAETREFFAFVREELATLVERWNASRAGSPAP